MKSKVIPHILLAILLFTACKSNQLLGYFSPEEISKIEYYKELIPKKDPYYHVLIATSEGDMMVQLFNITPLHRDNFISKVRANYYDSLEFHRVINDFMIQGGRPKLSPEENPYQGELIPAEFRIEEGVYHRRGALAAARTNNPEKASSSTQFYIVQRKPYRESQLDSLITERELTLNDEQKALYLSTGGTPHLDGGYTVFGKLELGYDVLDKIAETDTDEKDQPVNPIRMKMYLLNQPKKLK